MGRIIDLPLSPPRKLARTDTTNQIIEAVNGIRGSSVGGGVTNPQSYRTSHGQTRVKLMSASSQIGAYNGRLPTDSLPVNSDGAALVDADVGPWADADDCLIYLLSDIGASSNSITTFPAYLRGGVEGFDPATGKPIVVVGGSAGVFLFVVMVEVSGGADGDDTTPATYTYDAWLPAEYPTGDPIPLSAGPLWARPNGSVVPATHGIAYRTSEGVVLLMVDEIPATVTCDEEVAATGIDDGEY